MAATAVLTTAVSTRTRLFHSHRPPLAPPLSQLPTCPHQKRAGSLPVFQRANRCKIRRGPAPARPQNSMPYNPAALIAPGTSRRPCSNQVRITHARSYDLWLLMVIRSQKELQLGTNPSIITEKNDFKNLSQWLLRISISPTW